MIQDNDIYDKNITLPVQDSNELLDINTKYYEKKIDLYKDNYEKLINVIYNDFRATKEYREKMDNRIKDMWVWVERESNK